MTKIIGLTGGIGSGKSTIARLFEAEGVPVYIADDEAKKIIRLPETVKAIVSVFGKEVLSDTLIDRKKLASIVFNQPLELKKLNAIVHPLVKKHFDNWVLNQKTSFVIKEAAILFESGSYKYCDKTITVVTSVETRIKRVIARDNCTRDEVISRINAQMSDAEKVTLSDYIIENENLEIAKVQLHKILKKLNNLY